MKKYLQPLLIAILLILNTTILFTHKKTAKGLEKDVLNYKNGIEEKDKLLKSLLDVYTNIIALSKESENLKLNGQIKLTDLKGNHVLAKDIFKEDNLVLKYSIYNCQDCIDAELESLERFAKHFTGRITIITYYENTRQLIMDFKKLQEKGLEDIKIYRLEDNKLGLPIESYNGPYYFHVNSDLTVSNVFVPLKENPKLSEYYLKYSHKNYFDKKIENK